MDSTPVAGIIPDSSSSALAMATTDATADRPRPAKRVYGAGIIKRAFAERDPSPSSDEGAAAATVVPETVRTSRDREGSSVSGMSSPSPVIDQGGFYQGRAALQAQLDAIDTAPSPTTSPRRLVDADPLARSASSSQGSGGDTTLKTADTNLTSEPDEESPPVHRHEVKKPSRKGARIVSSSSGEDELPRAEEVLEQEAEKRRRRKVELEQRAAEKKALAEQEAARREASEDVEEEAVGKQQQKKKKKARTVESDQDEEMAALEKPVKPKAKAKGLTKKEQEDLNRHLAKYEREQAFNGIAANSRAPEQSLSSFLNKFKSQGPPAGAVASASLKATKPPTSSSPIEDGFSSQPGDAKVIELDTSSQSAVAAPRVPPLLRPEARSAPVEDRPSSDEDEELPDVDAAFDELKRQAEKQAAQRSKAEALLALKRRAAQRPAEAGQDSDSDLDIVVGPAAPTTSSRKTPRRTDTYDKLHHTAASKLMSKFAPEGHRKPRRHDSKGFLTESNLPTNTQIRTAGKTVHLRGQEGPVTPARTHPLAAEGGEEGATKKAKGRDKGEKKAALLDGKTLDQSLLARHRNQAAVVRSKKEADFVANGGQLFAERERLKKKKEDEDAKLKGVLEGARERMANKGPEEQEDDDDANDGDWQEEGQGEGDEEEEGEEWGSASEREVSGEEEEDEDPPSSSDEEGEAPDENADPRSISDVSGMMVPTILDSSEGALTVPSATGRLPFSQLPGYVSPPQSQIGTPLLPTDDDIMGLPGFGPSVRASTPSDDGGFGFSQTQPAPASPMEAPGFTQFFGASFTQDVGRRVGQQGFERASLADLNKQSSQCLLPAVEVLPEEYERDAIKLGAAAIFRDATPVDDRPELYLNDDGLLTQSKPAPRQPMAATPMSQFSMHTPFALKRNVTRSTVVDDDESQGLPQALIRRRIGMDDESQDLLTGNGHQPRVRRVIADEGEDEEEEAEPEPEQEPEEEQEQEDEESAPVERDAFSALMANRKRPSSPGAQPDKKGKKKKHRSEFVADAASESEDEYGMGVGADRHESDSGSDDEDSHEQVEGLVEDAPVDAELQAAQDELAAEKAKADEAERDAKLLKQMEDVAQGKVRKRRKEGDDWESDSEDDDEYARKVVNKHANKKRVRANGQAIEALADDERTAPFYGAYKEGTLAQDETEDTAFLQTPDVEMKAGSDSEGDDDGDSYGKDESEYEDDFVVDEPRKAPPMMAMSDDAPGDDGTRGFLAGGSSSPKQTLSFRNHASLHHIGAPERTTAARAGPVNNYGEIAHDDLRFMYESHNDWSETVRSNVAEAFKDDPQLGGDPSRRAGKGSAVTAFIRPKPGAPKAGGSDAALKAAKALGRAHAGGGAAAQKRHELMRPTKSGTTMTSIRQKAKPAK